MEHVQLNNHTVINPIKAHNQSQYDLFDNLFSMLFQMIYEFNDNTAVHLCVRCMHTL